MAWLAGWTYRKSHVINAAAGSGTDYQVRVQVYYSAGADSGEDVYCDSKCKTDFGDIRFTDDDGSTLLDYWMESKTDSNNAIFWVEVADDLTTDNQTIYVYYGKADATTTSNGYNTFLSFANFNDGTTDGITVVRGIWDNPSDFARSIGVDNTNNRGHSAYKGGSYTNYAVAVKSRTPTGVTVGNMGILGRWSGAQQGDDVDYTYLFRISSTTLWELYKRSGAGYSLLDSGAGSYSANVWYKLELQMSGTSISKTIDDVVVGTTKTDSTRESGYGGMHSFFQQYRNWDDFRIRKYISPEPAHGTWGAEETTGGVTIKKGGGVVNSVIAMLNSKMLYSAYNRYPKLSPQQFI